MKVFCSNSIQPLRGCFLGERGNPRFHRGIFIFNPFGIVKLNFFGVVNHEEIRFGSRISHYPCPYRSLTTSEGWADFQIPLTEFIQSKKENQWQKVAEKWTMSLTTYKRTDLYCKSFSGKSNTTPKPLNLSLVLTSTTPKESNINNPGQVISNANDCISYKRIQITSQTLPKKSTRVKHVFRITTPLVSREFCYLRATPKESNINNPGQVISNANDCPGYKKPSTTTPEGLNIIAL